MSNVTAYAFKNAKEELGIFKDLHRNPDYVTLEHAYLYAKEYQSYSYYELNRGCVNELSKMLLKLESKFGDSTFVPTRNFGSREMQVLEPTHYGDNEGTLRYIVYKTRRYLNMDMAVPPAMVSQDDIYKGALEKCLSSLKKKGIDAKVYTIWPGFSQELNLFEGRGRHFVLIVYLGGKEYLIDTNYSRFFYERNNFIERLGVCGLMNCYPGYYMRLTKERRAAANQLLTHGWIELTPENRKNLLDGYTSWYINGRYYEDKQDFSFYIPISAEEYDQLIRGEILLTGIIDRDHLGFQQKPLENPYMILRK